MEIILAAFLAGLMGSPHCIGMCGGFAAACARPRGSIWLWHAGRLTTYAAIGMVAGAFGSRIPGPTWVPAAISIVLLVWFALALADVVPQPRFRVPGIVCAGATLARREGPLARFLFGAATGLLPCGLLYAGVAIAVGAASVPLGGLAMLGFGLGTVPALSLLSVTVQRFASRGVWQRRVLATLVLAVGMWSVVKRVDGPAAHMQPGTEQAAPHRMSH